SHHSAGQLRVLRGADTRGHTAGRCLMATPPDVVNPQPPDAVNTPKAENGSRHENAGTTSRSRIRGRHIGLVVYLLFLIIPVYWLVTMSFKPNVEIITQLAVW